MKAVLVSISRIEREQEAIRICEYGYIQRACMGMGGHGSGHAGRAPYPAV